ncbi:NrsF family protein [Bosea sp. TAB14]|uniref:NrsF family protein n=1 Tax=Bosea sp. TAB14 TaxID=3237481 RepID=UPI003F915540
MDTAGLIRSLATNVPPVRRLRPPLVRAAGWLLLAAAIMGLMTVSHGVRPQFAERMQDAVFAINMVSSLLTGIFATIATFFVSLPDRSRRWLLLPVPALVVWLSTIGYQCFAGWVPVPPGAITVEAASGCLATLVLTSLPLSLLMLTMLRYAAALRPTSVILMGSLAVSAITSTALSMFHPLDATAMILGWNLGTAVLFLAGAALFSRRMSHATSEQRD